MSIDSILEQLVRDVPGARAALLLDRQGEVVLEAGERNDSHRLVAAYQGLALDAARQAAERCAIGLVSHLVTRYEEGSVVLQALKDGYFLVLTVANETLQGLAVHRSSRAAEALNAEI